MVEELYRTEAVNALLHTARAVEPALWPCRACSAAMSRCMFQSRASTGSISGTSPGHTLWDICLL